MVKLHEYIGSLVSGITNARAMSDIQTIRIAEDYARHPLLKHFSIPRMRIDDIEMTIPIALDELQEITQTVYEPIDNRGFNSIAYKEIVNSLGLSKFTLEASRKLQSEIAAKTQYLEQNIRLNQNIEPLKWYAAELAKYALHIAEEHSLIKRELLGRMDVSSIQQNLERILAREIKVAETKKVVGDLHVTVEAHKLREVKPENIIYIKLKISEDGMEWDHSETSDGTIESKLLPE